MTTKYKKLPFWRNCVGTPQADVDALSTMVRDAVAVTRDTFVRHVVLEDLVEQEKGLLYFRYSKDLTMAKDQMVGYFRSHWRGHICYFFQHSKIEYYFVDVEDRERESDNSLPVPTQNKPNPYRKMSARDAYGYIIKCFLLRREPDERVYQSAIAKDTGHGGYGMGNRNGAWTSGARMMIGLRDGVTVLLSYRMILAAWLGDRLVLNGDGAPTRESRRHQFSLRAKIEHLNGVRFVSEPEPPFKLWTEELRARWHKIEDEAKAKWRKAALDAHQDKCEFANCHCTHPNDVCICEPYTKFNFDKPVGNFYEEEKITVEPHSYSPLTTREHCWSGASEYQAAWALWETNPEWSAHSARWKAEKEEIHKHHQYHQKLAKHCAECGVEIYTPPDHANSANRIQPVHEKWCSQIGNSAKVFDLSNSFIPFSVLGYNTRDGSFMSWRHNDIVGLRFSDIEIVAATPDRKVIRTNTVRYKMPNRNAQAWGRDIYRTDADFKEAMVCPKCKQRFTSGDHTHTEDQEVHFLGETLFRTVYTVTEGHAYRYYVCGLDRNDNPGRRNFYMARLPADAFADPASRAGGITVDDALVWLKPLAAFNVDHVKRQGEWFFVPANKETNDFLNRHDKSKKFGLRRFPIATDDHSRDLRGRPGRHVAERCVYIHPNIVDRDHLVPGVYVRGEIRDVEHDTTYLGDVWHRVHRNTADGSWSVDKSGPKVD